MYCKKCGAPLDDDALFCSSCGQKVQESTQTVAKNVGQTNKKTPRWIGICLCAVLAIVVLGSLGESTSKTSGYNSASVKSSYSSSKSNYSAYSSPATTPNTGVSQEYQNALTKGLSYARNLHMSKKGVYDQLTSSYGEGFSADAAQYAIDNMTGVDWNENALAKAQEYYTGMSMSKSAVYDQLTSEYGEQFTASEARYAIDHLN